MCTHLENIYEKLHVSSRTAAVTHAFPDRMVQDSSRAGERVGEEEAARRGAIMAEQRGCRLARYISSLCEKLKLRRRNSRWH